ncbi:9139_t:CDS:2 [Cetraspora pellucida]|uniref:9139_t:CDS:1 n=1 Tax=Cetraspora pellucida TaxID=1433469 RepID=A0ACA9N9J9_9GLOM|nr:9139_t:CDS:2 [Cetraspora pellucida]
MTKYEITEEKFKSLINWKQMIRNSKCKVGPRGGRHSGTSGHENCSSCPGNYYHGGECNYGGHHVLAEEVALINKNFDGVDKLQDRHNQLRLSANTNKEKFEEEKNKVLNDFQKVKDNCCNPTKLAFYATCIGVDEKQGLFQKHVEHLFQSFAKAIDRYINQVQNLSFHEVEEFQAKVKEIEKLQEANKDLMMEYKDPSTSSDRKTQILALIKQNKDKIKNIGQELDKHPARTLFDPDTEKILRSAKKELFEPSSKNPFEGLGNSKGSGQERRSRKKFFIFPTQRNIKGRWAGNSNDWLIMGITAFLNWQSNEFKAKKGQKDYQEQERENTRAERDKTELEKLKKDLEGFSGQGLYKIHDLDVESGYLGIKGGGLEEEVEGGDKDNYSGYLVRNNCILYGAPGTGKTEFARELSRILIERYGEVPTIPQTSNDPNDPNYGMSIDPKEREMAEKGIKKPRIPLVEIKGASLQSAGPTVGDLLPQEKLVKILQRFKEEFFQGDDEEGNTGIASKLPYVVFVEEADQARNTMTDKPKRNLEDFKNFLSSSSDKDGLNTSHISQAAQDRNSVIIIATNNYEEIDPAIKRRGRLEETNPETAKQKEVRIEKATKDIEDKEEKSRIRQEEADKKFTACEHDQNLENFNHPNQIQRYSYNDARSLRERINQLRQDLNEYGQEVINTLGRELREINNKLAEIHD